MNNLEQIKALENLEKKLQDVLTEVTSLKMSLLRKERQTGLTKENIKVLKMNDLYDAIGKKKISYVHRIKDYCKENNIKTFEQFVSVTPSEFVCTKGIGSCTLRVVNKALEKLGVIWKDVK